MCVKMKEKFGSFHDFIWHPPITAHKFLSKYLHKVRCQKSEPEIILGTVLHRLCVQFEERSQTLTATNRDVFSLPIWVLTKNRMMAFQIRKVIINRANLMSQWLIFSFEWHNYLSLNLSYVTNIQSTYSYFLSNGQATFFENMISFAQSEFQEKNWQWL